MQLTIYQVTADGTPHKCSFELQDYMQIILAEYHLSNSPSVQDSGSWKWVVLFPSMVLLFDSNDSFAQFLNFLVNCLPAPTCASIGASGCDETHYACSDNNSDCLI